MDKLFTLFKAHHNDDLIGHDLLELFRLWSNFAECLRLLCTTILPYVIEIVRNYDMLTSQGTTKGLVEENVPGADDILDSSVLQHSLDLLCIMLKKSTPGSKEKEAILDVLPVLMDVLQRSEDTYLLLHSTNCMRTFLATSHTHFVERGYSRTVMEIIKRLLQPGTNESSA